VGISGQKNHKTVLEQFKYQNSEKIIVKINFKSKYNDILIFKFKNMILSVYKKIITSKLYDPIFNKLIKITDF
jgi:hypothetical protein